MKDQTTIMATVLQVAAAISALLLVFQGYYWTGLNSLPASTPMQVKRRYQLGILYVLVSLVLAIIVALGAIAWLIGADLFWVTIVLFILSLLSVVAVSVALTIAAFGQ